MSDEVRVLSCAPVRGAIACVVLAFLALAACGALPSSAGAVAKAPKLNPEGIERFSQNPSGEHPYFACPPATEVRMSCDAVVVPRGAKPAIRRQRRELGLVGKGITPALEGSGVEGGFSPADLRSAYNVPEAGGKGMTIAIVDAWGYPNAESDLSTYRAQYGLPPCTTANGCFRKVNQKGEEANYPPLETLLSWDLESALDLDMASAMCPECKLLLVEANNEQNINLGPAVNKAAELGATVISNSWGGEERDTEAEEDSLYYSHPGTPIFFSSGDFGYGAEYPSSSSKVVSVGGTSLTKDQSKRGWHESAWTGAGSGCSAFEKKPEWQTDTGCANRSTSDVSAVADPKTPVAVYAKGWAEKGSKAPGWVLLGGTSASAPILAGIEVRASEAERAKGAKLFWEQGAEGKLFDVTEGYNGTCGESPYLCSGKGGYDGPTGWGTPGAARPGPPVAGAYEPSEIRPISATLNGVVNPNGGGTTTYNFEYGTTTAYGFIGNKKSIPTGTSPIAVSMPIAGLTGNTTYHYRIYAQNSLGKTYGADNTFVASRWSFQDEPLETERDWFDTDRSGSAHGGVSCSSASDCIAIGSHLVKYESDSYQETHIGERYLYGRSPLAEHWDGSNWVRLSPIVPHEIDDYIESPFYRVSCTSATFCMLQGENFDFRKAGEEGGLPLLERWNGSELTLAPAVIPSDAYVDAKGFRHVGLGLLSCVSSSYCLTIGGYQAKDPEGNPVSKNMTQVWNGKNWEIVATQAAEGAFVGPVDLSCISPTWCMAIGENTEAGAPTVHISIWNGVKWSTQPSTYSGIVQSLSCTSSTSCVMVGTNPKYGWEEYSGLARVWNGSSWTSSSPGAGRFEDVSCLEPNWCLAVGYTGSYEKGGFLLPPRHVASRWDGSKWTVEDPPFPARSVASHTSELTAVSCKGTGCTAVGVFRDPAGIAPEAARLTLAPQNLTAPVVSPSTLVYEGVRESTTSGTWDGEAGSFSYQWQRCNAEGKECSNVAGATSSNYTPVAADVGKTLVAKVTAGGPGGSATTEAASNPTAKVQGVGGTSEYLLPAGSEPNGIALGPDGNLWFTEFGTSKIGKITASGTVTEYSLPSGSKPSDVTAGPDGKLWFTESGTTKIGKITTSGTVTEYALAAGAKVNGITAGPDGKLWFTNCASSSNQSIGKITTSGAVTEYPLSGSSCVSRIAPGPDGNLWFTQGVAESRVGKITTSGAITLYSLPASSNPGVITEGPDEEMWFTIRKNKATKIGKITTSGAITEYPLSLEASSPNGIVAGPDGNLWFADLGTGAMGRITTSGTISEYGLPVGFKGPSQVAVGPDSRIWFTGPGSSRIAAMVP